MVVVGEMHALPVPQQPLHIVPPQLHVPFEHESPLAQALHARPPLPQFPLPCIVNVTQWPVVSQQPLEQFDGPHEVPPSPESESACPSGPPPPSSGATSAAVSPPVTSWPGLESSFVASPPPLSAADEASPACPTGKSPRRDVHPLACTARDKRATAMASGALRESLIIECPPSQAHARSISKLSGASRGGQQDMGRVSSSLMRSFRRFLGMLPVALSCSVLTMPVAMAQSDADRAQARDLGQQGYAAMDARDYAKAADLFRRADALFHAPTIMVGLARAEVHLGRYVEAAEHYRRVVLEGAPPGAPLPIRDAVDAAKKELADAEAHRSKVTINVKGPDQPSVAVDGAPVSAAALGVERLVNPGQHSLHVTANGWKDADENFTVADGGSAQVTVQMEAAAAAAPAPATPATAPTQVTPPSGADQAPPPDTTPSSGGSLKTLGWIGIGVGGAGIVLGAVTGGLAAGKKSTASGSPCASGPCAPSDLTTYQSNRDGYYTMGTISTIGFIAGAVLAAGGAALLIFGPRGEAPPAASTAWVSPFVGPGSAGVTGGF